jgi:hypothetical protein
MVDLVHAGVLSEARALKVATQIRQANPSHITNALMERFRSQVRRS